VNFLSLNLLTNSKFATRNSRDTPEACAFTIAEALRGAPQNDGSRVDIAERPRPHPLTDAARVRELVGEEIDRAHGRGGSRLANSGRSWLF
jgi:hypothetical protein